MSWLLAAVFPHSEGVFWDLHLVFECCPNFDLCGWPDHVLCCPALDCCGFPNGVLCNLFWPFIHVAWPTSVYASRARCSHSFLTRRSSGRFAWFPSTHVIPDGVLSSNGSGHLSWKKKMYSQFTFLITLRGWFIKGKFSIHDKTLFRVQTYMHE